MPKAEKVASVTVKVEIDGRVVFLGAQAALRGLPMAACSDAMLEGMLKSAALRSVAQGGLKDPQAARKILDALNRENRAGRGGG